MASTYSPSLRLELMATGDQSGTWGDTTNVNLGTLLEQAITGVLSVAQGDVADLTLTTNNGASDQARNAVVNVTGALTGNRNVVVQTANKLYLVRNSTTGGFNLTFKTSGGSGVVVVPGASRWIYSDGTNVIDGQAGALLPSSNDAGALGASGTAWSDLFLAAGGVINFNAGDVLITAATNALAFTGASSGYSFDAAISGTTLALTSASAGSLLSLESTDAGATAGPAITLYRNSATPAANDILGQLLFNGEDSAGNTQEYASIEAVIADATSTSEDGVLDFWVTVAGTRTKVFSAQGTGFPLTSPINLGLATAVGSSALTISLKGVDGNDPSASNPVFIPFRNVTAATGTPSYLAVTAATSLVISSGSTMGFTSGAIGRLWIVGFNDAGTFRLGAVNCLSGTSIMALRDGIYSSTAEGGSGGADSAQTIYTGTAVTSKAMVVLGYLEATEATAGTWATAPSLVKVISQGDALPGDTVQVQRTETGAVATGSGTIPADDTIPQSTEGDQYMAQAITPASAANLLRVSGAFNFSVTASHADYISALFQDSGANALAATNITIATSGCRGQQSISHMRKAATISSTTFKWRAGPGDAGTTTFNGAGGARLFGGTMNSFMQVEEIMA